MGMIELEFGPIIRKAVETNQVEPLLRKMALIIERQAHALQHIEWSKSAVESAAKQGEIFLEELKEMAKV